MHALMCIAYQRALKKKPDIFVYFWNRRNKTKQTFKKIKKKDRKMEGKKKRVKEAIF